MLPLLLCNNQAWAVAGKAWSKLTRLKVATGHTHIHMVIHLHFCGKCWQFQTEFIVYCMFYNNKRQLSWSNQDISFTQKQLFVSS